MNEAFTALKGLNILAMGAAHRLKTMYHKPQRGVIHLQNREFVNKAFTALKGLDVLAMCTAHRLNTMFHKPERGSFKPIQ